MKPRARRHTVNSICQRKTWWRTLHKENKQISLEQTRDHFFTKNYVRDGFSASSVNKLILQNICHLGLGVCVMFSVFSSTQERSSTRYSTLTECITTLQRQCMFYTRSKNTHVQTQTASPMKWYLHLFTKLHSVTVSTVSASPGLERESIFKQ